jgi:photosystem II stability/assembly factor-like uncharacterized protein
MRVVRCIGLLLGVASLVATSGCRREEAPDVPLLARLIGVSDKFYDVQALDADHAVVVGYGGKILITADGGFTWSQAVTPTDGALYRVRFVDANTGWVSGQDGIILHTTDGGKTWQRQSTSTTVYLFSLYFLDANSGWAVGDKSIYLETHDGGNSWVLRKVSTQAEKEMRPEEAIASADPILYDVQFVDANTGWIVGEFGKIFHTTDGGKIWNEQENSLIGGEVLDALDLPTFFGVRFVNASEGVTSGLDGKIARTSDGGATWKFEKMKLDYPIVDPLYSPYIFADGTGWAVGGAGEVVRLTAAAGVEAAGRVELAEWQRVKLGMEVLTWLRGIYWLDHDNGWVVGGYGLILHTKDGGKTWIPSLA